MMNKRRCKESRVKRETREGVIMGGHGAWQRRCGQSLGTLFRDDTRREALHTHCIVATPISIAYPDPSQLQTSILKMAILSANNMIRSISLFHVTLAVVLLKNPALIAKQGIVLVLGQSMQLVRVSQSSIKLYSHHQTHR
jgi:hypothetical protein